MKSTRTTFHTLLAQALTKTASYAPAAVDVNLDRYRELVVTLNVTACDAAGTYDFYLITGAAFNQGAFNAANPTGGLAEWDLVHFAQIAGTPGTFVARMLSDVLPQTVTTAAPGVAANTSGTIAVASGALNAPLSLAAGSVRHGPWGDTLRLQLVAAGTITTGVTFSLQVQARD